MANLLGHVLVAIFLLSPASGRTPPRPRDDAPANSGFLRRTSASAIVIGAAHVYIDGGELSHLQDGNSPSGRPSFAVNETISISLETSWTNATVAFNRVEKPQSAPHLGRQAIWKDPNGSGFYVWGGSTSYATAPPPPELWKFSTDGSGGGSWAKQSSDFEGGNIVRTTDGAWAQSRDVGYFMGGKATQNTDLKVASGNTLAVPGLLAFVMTTNKPSNLSSVGLGPFGTLVGGSAHFIPFGTPGVLLFLGGSTSPISATEAGWVSMDFTTLTLYDLKNKQWLTQTTTGARPTPRERFCAVGVQGTNNTYEIFMYGGITTDSYKSTDEVYVLSLPGFVFFKVTAPGFSTKRADHTCVFTGRRQLLSVGGIDTDVKFPDNFLDPDPWANGLGVFDLTDLIWRDRYDAEAAPYQSPAVVREWYSKFGVASVKWSSDAVTRLFTELMTPPERITRPTGPHGDSPSGTPGGLDTGSKIAIVVSVCSGVGISAAMVFCYCKGCFRCIRPKKEGQKPIDATQPQETCSHDNWTPPGRWRQESDLTTEATSSSCLP
ncbi:hypothetical protein QBC34DRAFT_149052 [Podospora aff. communis PSN243]|uniref:Kelch repeat protein n=1 Tax=Podospora aff. communis PSN243 TaxID=3040156 RepID=A0AAV9GFB6_9PEZI|nr:hypothetical protein QBC34DRAFT_149052 [Podospora aff. communis PSN243]